MKNEISIVYGTDPVPMVQGLLKARHVASRIPHGARIGIKPNLVVAKPASSGATTDPGIVAGILGYLHDNGFEDICILESAWVGDSTARAFEVCGYVDLASKFGVELVNLELDSSMSVSMDGDSFEVCTRATEIDYLINVPVLKAHCQTRLTCALKNLKGCIPDREKRRFHSLGLHRPIVSLNRILRTDLVVVDGIVGDLSYEEGGNPVNLNRVILGEDPVLVDSYCATILGFEPFDIEHVRLASEAGIGSADLGGAKITRLNEARDGGREIAVCSQAETLRKYIDEDEACSACMAGLFHGLSRLKERGELNDKTPKIAIGQGFIEKKGKGIGIGVCTSGFAKSLDGCPPTAQEIVEFLRE
jgi:uncharacterized protein (DUF362 family)